MGKNGILQGLVISPFKLVVFVMFLLVLFLQVPAARNIATYGGTAAGQAVGLAVVFVKSAISGASQTMPDINPPAQP